MKKPAGQLEEWEWIERYWSGQLSATEQAFFEQMMQEDDRLAQEANDLHFGVLAVNEARIEANARQTLSRLQQAGRRRRQGLIWWGTAAGALAAACVAFVCYLAYAPVALPLRESDPGVLRDFWGQYRADSTDQLSLRQKQTFDLFFEGQAYLAEGQPRRAAKRFERVLTVREIRPYFREAAQWHLVICYLKTARPDKARELYNQLGQTEDYEMSRLERWKVWWHLQRLTWFGQP